VLIGEIIAVYLQETDETHKRTLCGKNIEFFNVQTVGRPTYRDDSNFFEILET
jgi:hypothetical protein